MRRTLFIALGTAVALVTAAVAFAAVFTATGVTATTATFTANTVVDHLKVRTCDSDPGYAITDGHYSGGTIAFTNPALALDGDVMIHARTTLNTAGGGLGYVEGSFRVKKSGESLFSGKFSGTLSSGVLVGFLTGKSHGNHAKVLGNMSAPFVPATGFGAGNLGAGSATSALAVIAGPVCKGPKHEPKGPKPDEPKRVHVEGSLTAPLTLATLTAPLTTGTITVTSKKGPTTCTIAAGSALGSGFSIPAKVEMECEWVGTPAPGILTLTKLKLHT